MASTGQKLLIAGLLSVAFGGVAAKLGEAAPPRNDAVHENTAPDIRTAAGQEHFLQVCASKPPIETALGQECKAVPAEALKGVKPLKPVR
jgi:hypothetical protein